MTFRGPDLEEGPDPGSLRSLVKVVISLLWVAYGDIITIHVKTPFFTLPPLILKSARE